MGQGLQLSPLDQTLCLLKDHRAHSASTWRKPKVTQAVFFLNCTSLSHEHQSWLIYFFHSVIVQWFWTSSIHTTCGYIRNARSQTPLSSIESICLPTRSSRWLGCTLPQVHGSLVMPCTSAFSSLWLSEFRVGSSIDRSNQARFPEWIF